MLLGKLVSEKHKEMFLNLELWLVEADGHFDDMEKRLVDQHCAEMGISNNEYKKEKALDEIIKEINIDMSVEEKKIIFIELLAVSYVDDEFSDEEKKFVKKIQDILQISDDDARQAEEIVVNLISYTRKLEAFVATYSKELEEYIGQ